MQTRRWLAAGVAMAGGFVLWAASPLVFGRVEPWDGSVLRYCALVLGLGAGCAAIASPRYGWDKLLWPAAFVTGEALFLLTTGSVSGLAPLSLVALGVGAVPAVVGVTIVLRARGVDDASAG